VKKIAAEPEAFGVVFFAGGRGASSGCLLSQLACAAVKRVADHGMTDGSHVHADLVGAPGFNSYLQQSEFAEAGVEAPHDFIVGDRGASIFAGPRGHAGAPDGIAADTRADGAFLALDRAVDQRDVGFLDVAAENIAPRAA